MILTANQYRTELAGTTSTGSLLSADFGFTASYVRIANGGTVPLRVTLASSVASTGDLELVSGEVLESQTIATHVLGLMTTSTSTDGTDHRRARVLALGG